MTDRNIMAWLVYAFALCLSVFCVSGARGSDALYYAAGPLAAWCGLTFVSEICSSSFTSRQTAYRLGRDRLPDALLFIRAGVLDQLLLFLVVLLLLVFRGDWLSGVLFGTKDDLLVLYALLPGLAAGWISGPLRGFLDGCGLQSLSRMGLYPASVVTVVCSIVFSGIGRSRGVQVAQLLLHTQYGALYGGTGLALGVSTGCVFYFIFLLICFLLARQRFLWQEEGFGSMHEESLGGIMPYYLRSLLVPFLLTSAVVLSLLIDYRLGLHLYGGTDRTGFGLHWWDGCAGVAYPAIFGIAALVTVVFSRMPLLCVHELEEERHKRFRLRYSMMFRLSSYVSIAASAFVFGAAKPIVQLARHGLNQQARESAVLNLKLGSVSIFLITTAVLLFVLFWESGYEMVLLAAAWVAFVIQFLTALLFMHVLQISVKAMPLSMDVFWLVFLLMLMILASNTLLRHTDTAWVVDVGLTIISAAAADIPVCILNDFMTDEIIPAGSIFLLLLIFVVCYVLFSLFFGAVDLRNIDRVPGGKYIVLLAQLLHRK